MFLNKQFAIQDLNFWMETENFCTTDKFKDFKARQIRKKFFNQQYFLGPQSPATKEQQLQVCTYCSMILLTIQQFSLNINKVLNIEAKTQGWRLSKRPSSAAIREAQKYARARLENKWLPMYLESSVFKQRCLDVNFDGERHKVYIYTVYVSIHLYTRIVHRSD